MKHNENSSEELFARLCSSKYFGGFVYQNPKFTLQSEAEAGDVIVWVRDWLIIFEVIWKDADASSNMKNFIKRIGSKRDQLLNDFKIYTNPEILITMTNEDGEPTEYDYSHFNERTTRGVVIVDAEGPIGQLHYDTLRLTAEAPHPIAVMTRQDFETLFTEADTVGDLGIYLEDRYTFLKEVFFEDPTPFLRLGESLEQELVGLYKLHDNKFNVDIWKQSSDKRFWERYQSERREEIELRDAENLASGMLDDLISVIRAYNHPNSSTLQHSWEMAVRLRRERVHINEAIQKKFDNLMRTGRDQQFAIWNHHMSCWDVFYLHAGGDKDFFHAEAQRMANRKMWVERELNNFGYSVLCFAIRYLLSGSGEIEEVWLTGSDARQWPSVTPEQLDEARKYFAGKTNEKPIIEFPSS